MDTVFYIVSMIVALGLFVLIARNLWLMDKREREQLTESSKKKKRTTGSLSNNDRR
jgi:hypothetical protein